MSDDYYDNLNLKSNLKKDKSQCYIMSHITSKLLNEDSKKEAKEKIKEYFEDPSKYLDVAPNIVVGKKPSGPKYDEKNHVIARTVIGDPKLFRKIIDSAKSAHNKNDGNQSQSVDIKNNVGDVNASRASSTMFGNSFAKRRNNKANSQVLQDYQLELIFKQAQERVEKAKTKINKEILGDEKMPKTTKDFFYKQEKVLEYNNNQNLKSQSLSRAISAKIHKPEDELLMNRTDAFRFKKQIIDIIDGSKPTCEKFGDNGWILSLRREKVPTTMRINYINVGSNFEPKWKPLIEYPPKKMPIIQKPNLKVEKEVKSILKSPYYQDALKEANIDIHNMQNIARMEIQGKNLLEDEMKKIKEIKGIKRIFVDPFAIGKNVESEIIKSDYNFRESRFSVAGLSKGISKTPSRPYSIRSSFIK
jgi:hypothetical protein